MKVIVGKKRMENNLKQTETKHNTYKYHEIISEEEYLDILITFFNIIKNVNILHKNEFANNLNKIKIIRTGIYVHPETEEFISDKGKLYYFQEAIDYNRTLEDKKIITLIDEVFDVSTYASNGIESIENNFNDNTLDKLEICYKSKTSFMNKFNSLSKNMSVGELFIYFQIGFLSFDSEMVEAALNANNELLGFIFSDDVNDLFKLFCANLIFTLDISNRLPLEFIKYLVQRKDLSNLFIENLNENNSELYQEYLVIDNA